jgi:hypothetical protein
MQTGEICMYKMENGNSINIAINIATLYSIVMVRDGEIFFLLLFVLESSSTIPKDFRDDGDDPDVIYSVLHQ